MKITKDTSLQELRQVGIVDKEVYLYLSEEGYKLVNDVVIRKDSVYWNSQKSDVRSFAAFIQSISEDRKSVV